MANESKIRLEPCPEHGTEYQKYCDVCKQAQYDSVQPSAKGQTTIIEISWAEDCYVAKLQGSNAQGVGDSQNEAIGDLIRTHSELFQIKIEAEDIPPGLKL